MVGREVLRDDPEELRERLGLGVHVEEDEAAPGVAGDLDQRRLLGHALGERVFVRHELLRAIEVELEEVIGALESLGVAHAGVADLVAAVGADVVEGAHLVRLLAHDQERLGAELRREVITHVGDVGRSSGDVPDLRPHPLPLELHERFRRIALFGD